MPRLAPGRVVPLDPASGHGGEGLPSKAKWLLVARRAGLPVPDGFVVGLRSQPSADDSAAFDDAATRLLKHGPVIVRSALVGEDEANSSAAGLGLSVPGLTTLEAVRTARDTVATERASAALQAVRGAEHREGDGAIVQRQVQRHALIVGALLPSGVDYIEVHDAHHTDALAEGITPDFSGLVERWEDASSTAVAVVLGEIRERLGGPPFGLDVELVVDDSRAVHVVQVRPLTRDLEADGRAFLQAVRLAGHAPRLQGRLVLDAEHNPEPLSAAHASLIAQLAVERPSSGHPTTLAGWLYVRTKVRDLGRPSATGMSPVQALARLSSEWLPQARARLDAVDNALTPADRSAPRTPEILEALAAAQTAFLEMIDVYLRDLLPVRAAAGAVLATRPQGPLSLDQRAGFADVLPTRWDIAAPSLAEHREFRAPTAVSEPPTDPTQAAVLLTEWDDHLFALGLAPVRRVYLAAAGPLGLDGTSVFGLELHELRDALRDGGGPELRALAEQRLRDHARWSALRPPALLDEGRPLPALPRRHLRGLGLGPTYTGPLAQRANLDALLADPPPAEAIVVLPALTAQAALVLHELGVRAVCCEHGGALSHAALMIRELGLTGLIGAQGSTELPDGAQATIDTARGRIQIASSVTLGS